MEKYELFGIDENASLTAKINSIVQALNQLGRISNDVVQDWQKVMEWAMGEGLDEATNKEIETLIANGRFEEIIQTALTEFNGRVDSVETQLAQIVIQAPAPNGVDDTQALKSFFALGYKNVQLKGIYKINLSEGGFIASYTNTDNIKIMGQDAKIIDLKANYTNNGAVTPLFKFDNCKNIDINIDYEGQPLASPTTDLGYTGATVVYFTTGCENIKIKGKWTNFRYGVLSGNYSIVSLGNCKGFNIDITGQNGGYPIALYLAERVKANLVFDGVHRVAYLAGVLGAKVSAYFKNQYIADTSVLITDTTTGTGTSRGCSNLDIYVEDLGSTIFQPTSVLAGIALQRVDPGTKYSNIKVVLKLQTTDTIATTMNGFRITSGVKSILPSYPFNWEPTIEINDLTISGTIDRSAQTVSSGVERAVAIRAEDGTHYGTLSNINFDGLRIIEMTGNTKNFLVQAKGLMQGLSFKDCNFSNIILEVFSNVSLIHVSNSKFDRVQTSNKLNLIGSTVKTIVGTDFAEADIHNSFVGGSGVETKVKYLDFDLSSSLTKIAAIPSSALVLGITGVVTEAVQGTATAINVGTTTTANEFGTAVAIAVGTSFRPNSMGSRDNLPRFYISSTDVVIAPYGAGTITAGKVRLCIAYMQFTAPTL